MARSEKLLPTQVGVLREFDDPWNPHYGELKMVAALSPKGVHVKEGNVKSSCARGLRKLSALGAAMSLLAATAPVVIPVQARAESPVNSLRVDVSGDPIADLATNPQGLSPNFDPTITDYVLRCQSGSNPIQLTVTAAPGGVIKVDRIKGQTVTVRRTLVENQALIVSAARPQIHSEKTTSKVTESSDPQGAQYWIRCLPHDFPAINVTRPGSPQPGWYLTSNLVPSAGSTYAMVLDNHGTPVWYQRTTTGSPFDVTPVSDHAIAWMTSPLAGVATDPAAGFEIHDLRTQITRFLAAPTPPTDFHEFQPMSNGHFLMMSSPLTPNVDMTALGLGARATIVDCLLHEVDSSGHLVWEWRASTHVSIRESTHPILGQVRRQDAYDVFHCNSIDSDSESGNVLVSFRHTDAVYLINKRTGNVIWKLGGNDQGDNARVLKIIGDPEGAFHAQHDARFQPNGDISLYDDQSWDASLAARGVEYHVDPAAGTADLVWSYQSADGHNSAATGSFRRLSGGSDNVIGWGVKTGTLFTEVDTAGRVLMDLTFPNNNLAYRVIKVQERALDHNLLRTTAGLPPQVVIVKPRIAFMGPASGPAAGGGTVNILGTGFTGATAVMFGSNAASFTVTNDLAITAIAPAGSGPVNVVISSPGGISAVTPANQLETTASDSSFEGGTGSWRGSANTEITVSSVHARSGAYSLQILPIASGAITALSGRYSVPAGSQVTGKAFVWPASGSETIQLVLTFYDASGTVLSSDLGPSLNLSSTNGWTELTESTVAPNGTFSVAVGISDEAASGPIYVDDVGLVGATQYAYLP